MSRTMTEINVSLMMDKTSSGHERITHEICGEAIVKQPFMSEELWRSAVEGFVIRHSECERARKV